MKASSWALMSALMFFVVLLLVSTPAVWAVYETARGVFQGLSLALSLAGG